MFAVLALIAFGLELFDVPLGHVDLVVLGLFLVAAHMAFGEWPFGPRAPWRRSP
jgi:hypothetical protein